MSQKVEIEIFECSERLPDEGVNVTAYHTRYEWIPLYRFSPSPGSPILQWHGEDGPLGSPECVTHWFVSPELPKPRTAADDVREVEAKNALKASYPYDVCDICEIHRVDHGHDHLFHSPRAFVSALKAHGIIE